MPPGRPGRPSKREILSAKFDTPEYQRPRQALLKEMVLDALDRAGGVDWLVQQSQANPVAFMGLLSKVIPLQLEGNHTGPVLIVTGVPRPGRDVIEIEARPHVVNH